MRNLKKYLAVIIAVAMMVTLMVPAFAASGFSYESEAQDLNDLGLYNGVSTETFDPDLGTALNRETGVTLLVRLMGLEADALALTDAEVEAGLAGYTDVAEVSDWAKPYMAYAVTNGLVKGVTETTLAAKDALLGKAYATLVLRAMGYDPDYNSACAELSNKGGLSTSEALKFNDKALIKDDLVGISYGSLKAEYADGDTIAEKLVAAGAIDEDAAVDAGVIAVADPTPATSDELEVVSVKPLNLKQMEVVFSMPVDEDSAEDHSNYDLDGGDAELSTDDGDFELQDDGVTVLITFEDAASNKDKIDVTIEDVEALEDDDIVVERYVETDVLFSDDSYPEALSAKVTGNDTIKVVFSEPLNMTEVEKSYNAKDLFDVEDADGDSISVKSSSLTSAKNETEISFEISGDFEEGTITLDINSGLEDYNGLTAKPDTFTLEVVEDTEGPTIVDYKDAKKDEITLVFNEDIEIKDEDKDNYYHTNSNNEIDDNIDEDVDLDGNELTLHFDDNELPLDGYIYITDDSIKDKWDNANEGKISIKFEIDDDNTRPYVKKITVEESDEIIVKFNEDVEEVDKSDFTVRDEDGDKVSISDVSVDDNEVTLTFYEDLDGDYTIEIEDLEDAAGNEIDSVTLDFSSEDKEVPTVDGAVVYDAGGDDQKIRVKFSDAMATSGTYSVLDPSKYVIDNGDTDAPYDLSDLDCDVDISMGDDDESVIIEIASKSDDSEDGIDIAANDVITVARVADEAGNYTDDLSTALTIKSSDTISIDLYKVKATSTTKLKMYIDEKVEFEEDDLVVYALDDSNKKLTIETDGVTQEYDDGETLVYVSLDEDTDLNTDATYDDPDTEEVVEHYPVYIDTVAQVSIESEDEDEVKLSELAGTINLADGNLIDDISPAIAVFDEDIDDTDAVYEAAYDKFDGDEKIIAFDTDDNNMIDTIVVEFTEDISSDNVNNNTFDITDIDTTSTYVVDATNIYAASTASDANEDGKFVVIKLKTTDDDIKTGVGFTPEVVLKNNIYDAADNNELEADNTSYSSLSWEDDILTAND